MNKLIARYYFSDETDEKNVCTLSNSYLHIRLRNKLDSFHLDSIQSIVINQKILLMPIILGGIIAPLALLVLFDGRFNVWLMMTLAIAGFLLIYYGFVGMKALSITTHVKEYNFFLRDSPVKELKAFVHFTLKFIYTREINYFAVLDKSEWQKSLQAGFIQKDPLRLLEKPIMTNENQVLLVLNPFSKNIEITYKPSKENKVMFLPETRSQIPVVDISEMDGLL